MRLNSKFYDQKENDGAAFTCSVDSYLPNGYGLYNIAGNVNKMVAGKRCKGGSWLSYSYFLQINQHEPYEGATSYTGFRVVARK